MSVTQESLDKWALQRCPELTQEMIDQSRNLPAGEDMAEESCILRGWPHPSFFPLRYVPLDQAALERLAKSPEVPVYNAKGEQIGMAGNYKAVDGKLLADIRLDKSLLEDNYGTPGQGAVAGLGEKALGHGDGDQQ